MVHKFTMVVESDGYPGEEFSVFAKNSNEAGDKALSLYRMQYPESGGKGTYTEITYH